MEQNTELLKQPELGRAISELQTALDGLIRALPSEHSADRRLRATVIAGKIAEQVESLVDLGFNSSVLVAPEDCVDSPAIEREPESFAGDLSYTETENDPWSDEPMAETLKVERDPWGVIPSQETVDTADLTQPAEVSRDEMPDFGLSGRKLEALRIVQNNQGRWLTPAEITEQMTGESLRAKYQAWQNLTRASRKIPSLAQLLQSHGNTASRMWRYGLPKIDNQDVVLEVKTTDNVINEVQPTLVEADDVAPSDSLSQASEARHEPRYRELTDWGLAIKQVEGGDPEVVIGKSSLFSVNKAGVAILDVLSSCPDGKSFNALTDYVSNVFGTNIPKGLIHEAVEDILVQFKMRGHSDKLIVDKIKMDNGSYQRLHKLVGALGGATPEKDENPDFLVQ